MDYLSPQEIERFLSVIESERDQAVFLLAYRHGLRAREVGRLSRDDVNFQKRTLKIHRVKGSHGGEHPLQPDEIRILKAYLRSRTDRSPALFLSRRNQPISRQMLDRLMKRYAATAGLPKCCWHFHVLRHSIAVHLLAPGTPLHLVQHWLGHVNVQNTQIYQGPSP